MLKMTKEIQHRLCKEGSTEGANPLKQLDALDEISVFRRALAGEYSKDAERIGIELLDYFDRKTDMVNRPETVIIGKYINRRFAMIMHLFLNTCGVALGVYLSIYIGIPLLSVSFFLIAGLLWFYSCQTNIADSLCSYFR